MTDKPNVLLFITDGHRADALGCYGNELLETPNIDAFAEHGVKFERAFCTHSVCMPTRASIYTGRYPHVHGVWANGLTLPASEVTMAQAMADAGYATGAAGKIHFEPQQAYNGLAPVIEGEYYGFQEVHMSENCLGKEYLRFIDERFPDLADRARKRDNMPEEAHDLYWITSQAIDFMRRQVRSDKPFFCHCSFHELSPPSNPPETFAGKYRPEDMRVPELRPDDLARKPPFYRQCYEGYSSRNRQPDEATLRRYIASYYDQASFIDKQFGRLVAALQDLGAWDNTIVLVTADHGLSLCDHYQWRHGPFLFDEVTNVPMIWRVPGIQAPGRSTAELVEGVDIMPTVLELCGAARPAGVQGRSIVRLVQGLARAKGRDSVLLQERQAPDLACRGIDPNSITQYAVRTHEFKLVHYPGQPFGELYDLRNDPGEFVNRWADAGYAKQRGEMERLLLDRLADAQDPLPERHYDW